MPGHHYAEIATRLLAAGAKTETPCVVVSRASSLDERMHFSSIGALHNTPQLPAPTLLIVGDVVKSSKDFDSQVRFTALPFAAAERLTADEEAAA